MIPNLPIRYDNAMAEGRCRAWMCSVTRMSMRKACNQGGQVSEFASGTSKSKTAGQLSPSRFAGVRGLVRSSKD
ncbi:hypothetical protein LMG29542_01730 [Paraburkholderia humisilvae]|uniref:Uncharacterized protein n=1 Tax=Paraburkholderia humisilvae TaxID=627669 RepID=A0A6J5DDR7_9BURK|nr:hypothetical protein LMG29542_01730 [Paraburkholderia humisilvae]